MTTPSDNLLDIPTTPTTAQNYTLTVWTDLATDAVRRNDTIRTAYTFRSLAESTLCCHLSSRAIPPST